MNALANAAPLAANDQDELHAAATASLEGLIARSMEVAISTVESGEPSELVKDFQDMVLEIACIIALKQTAVEKTDKKTGLIFTGWNELQAANALGITHKELRAAIKKFGILEPLPDDGQAELFE
jgi:transcriptional regulator with GAF, ATPase, and Fis domain